MLEFVKGNMFDAPADIRVNTVNCVGVMGAGVALAFKQRYPGMFKDYRRDCKHGRVQPGTMHIWKSLTGDWIINFPTKRDWREPSRYEDIDAGLDNLRSYLNDVGPVTIALPALGCGHGGLDWDRVSRMIRDKLDGVDARVLVFEPAASRLAGRTATEQPSANELNVSEQLGYELMEGDSLPELKVPGPLFVLGRKEFSSHKWVALLPSRNPGDRELHALRAIAAELARFSPIKTVALVYGTRASEEIAGIFLGEGLEVVMLLPFGILTRKSLAKHAGRNGAGSLTLISTAPANGKWSRQIFAQTVDLLRQNAEAVLLSDPEPDWLAGKGLAKWSQTPISFVRYETTPAAMRDALERGGARPIGRRGEKGAPNIDFLIGKESETTASGNGGSTKESSRHEKASEAVTNCAPRAGANVFAIELDEDSDAARREIFDALLRMTSSQVAITVKLPTAGSEADRRRLFDLGFSGSQNPLL